MLKTRFLSTVFVAALVLVGLLIPYIYFVVHPSYHELLVEKAEHYAVRYVNFLVHAYGLDEAPIQPGRVPPEVVQDVGRFMDDAELIKLRFFDSTGKIVYSTMPKEIGRVNQYPYFHETVAHGNVYSKIVRKDSLSAEMEIVKTDLVETYVPLMYEGKFQGAVEAYHDVTQSSKSIRTLTTHSILFLCIVSFLLLMLLYVALRQADLSILAREHAEDELRKSNEELENRVAERTGELVRANQSLNDEIAERTTAQSALRQALSDMEEAKEKIDGILRSVTDGILVVDQNERIVLMNRPAEEIVGVTSEDSSGRDVRALPLRPALEAAIDDVLSGQGRPGADFELPSAVAERPRVFQARASQLRDRDESVVGTVILMQDVSYERQIERMKSDFLAMAAHELMTPLASIMGYAELLSSETEAALGREQKQEFLAFILHKAEGLSRIVDDLLDISRIESGQRLSVVRIEFDFCHMIRKALAAFIETEVRHRFEFTAGCEECRIFADPIRLEQVVENLLSNAVKYSPAGGDVRVRCAEDHQSCCLSVADDGIGMSAEQVEHIFDKFYRVDVSNTARRGLGLGMSIVKHIVDVHGGTIVVDSEIGKGTRVAVTLPREENRGEV